MKLDFTYSRILMVKKTKVRQNGEAPIYLRITIDGLRVEILTKKWVALDKWNLSTQTVRGNTEEIRVINTFCKPCIRIKLLRTIVKNSKSQNMQLYTIQDNKKITIAQPVSII